MDFSKNLNPFLFDEPVTSDVSDPASNPFLSGDTYDYGQTSYTAVNPFSDTQIDVNSMFPSEPNYAQTVNPFGDTTDAANLFDIQPVDNANIQSNIFDSVVPTPQTIENLFDSPIVQQKPPPPRPPSPRASSPIPSGGESPVRPSSPGRPPPPRPPPPSKETKDLLQTVIGAMDATTDTLQEKLVTTRTPCPSPGAARSPTPDITITGPEKESDAFSAVFGQTIELSDPEMDEQEDPSAKTEESETETKNEDIDLFGDISTQSKPKTTQDILSLFNKPKEEKNQIDLLSGDLPSDEPVKNNAELLNNIEVIQAQPTADLISEEKIPKQSSNIENNIFETNEAKIESVINEGIPSPDQISERSNSEPTVIEAGMLLDKVNIEGEIPLEIDNIAHYKVDNIFSMEPISVSQIDATAEKLPDSLFSPKEEGTTIIEQSVLIANEPNIVDNVAQESVSEGESTFKDKNVEIIHNSPTTADTVSNIFGVPDDHTVFPEVEKYECSTGADIFGNGSAFDPPFTETTGGVLFDTPAPASVESTAAALFETPAPAPASVESTGATLFETQAPAPNVGMSLFGVGQEAALDIFAESDSNKIVNPFAPVTTPPSQNILPTISPQENTPNVASEEEFDAFSARFDNVSSALEADSSFDPFGGNRASSPWGQQIESKSSEFGFNDNAEFDSFLALREPPPVPQSTPRHTQKQFSADSDEGQINIVIKPASDASTLSSSPAVPILAPPPAVATTAFTDSSPRFNPFDRGEDFSSAVIPGYDKGSMQRSDSQETPPTPLFEEDQSVPLEPYPRTHYEGQTWEMYIRQPNKKKITGQRFWKKVFVNLIENDGTLRLYNNKDDKEPFQELPLQPCYSVSDIGAQQFDQYGKIFTVKLQYMFYKERPGVRPGQISKAERITNKLSKFAQYAIAGDYEGVKEFASDVRKLGMPVEHAPQISQLLKLGTQNYEELKVFASVIEEYMFKISCTRERALTYKSEEVQLTAVDEIYVEQDTRGAVTHMVARVRIFFLSFLSGMPEVDLGINDLRKQGHEVVGRHDIIPVITEEWIRLEDILFHCTVDNEEFDKTRHIKFRPPDACYIELMRFRVRPPRNRELPLQVKTKIIMQGRKIEIICEILVPGFSGRKLGQVPCEDVAIRFPLPECWIYLFRVEKHFRYGSVKSAHRRTGKVKGIERLKGAVETAESALMEVTSGQAKYEHQHRAIVWRMSRLPKEGQGAYTLHTFTCKMMLTAFDQMPETLDKYCMVEFTMPATTVSHCVMRSVSVTSDDPPEKYVRYLARHEYKVEIEFSSGSGPSDYIAATMKESPKNNEEENKNKLQPMEEESSSDESS